jgi:hypothetical protein
MFIFCSPKGGGERKPKGEAAGDKRQNGSGVEYIRPLLGMLN